MGGVMVFFVMFGDINFVELEVLIGFVGFRVIKEIIKKELLEGF